MVKTAILGFAHGHVNSLIGQWKEHPEYGVEVVCGWDHDAERARKSCESHGIACCETLEDALRQASSVVITAETNWHAPLVEQAAAAKKDIILYKPICLNMAEADRIVRAVNENGVRLSMGWQMRTDPQNQKMRELIQSQALGKTCLFRRRHGLGTQNWKGFETTWHVNPKNNRDIFADDSAHPINLMQWIFGMPETVSCEMSTMVNAKIPNDNAVALFRYANGLICEISCSFTCVASEITTEVYCENGSIQQYFGDNPAASLNRVPQMPGLKWVRTGEKDWTDSGIESPSAHAPRLGWQAKPLADFLQGGEPVCTAEEGRDTLRLVLACYLSSQEGRRVSVYDPRIQDME